MIIDTVTNNDNDIQKIYIYTNMVRKINNDIGNKWVNKTLLSPKPPLSTRAYISIYGIKKGNR
jgi:hypothetical protein